MHITLTDQLTCPRCGPEFGLILLAERIVERRVLEGSLGCSNCRERYPIGRGFADLRPPGREPLDPVEPPVPATEEEAFRLAALLGVTEGPGFVLVVGRRARLVPGIAAAVEGIEAVGADAALAGWPERPGVNRLAAGAALPFASATMHAVALPGTALAEGARVLRPKGRLVLEAAPDDADARLDALGLSVLARKKGVVVAVRR